MIYGFVYPFYLWHGSFVILFLLLHLLYASRLPISLTLWVMKRIQPIRTKIEQLQNSKKYEGWDQSRRRFLQNGVTILAGTTFAGATYGAFTKNSYEISNAKFTIQNLPTEFDGFTITLLADIHSSIFMTKSDMDEYVKVINDMRSDLILIPGDFVNSQLDEVYPLTEAFSELQAPFGAFGSLGNHDFFTDADEVARQVSSCGVRILRNEIVDIQKEGARFHLMGVDDVSKSIRAGQLFDFVLEQSTPNVPRILLCHRPYFFEQAAERGIDLTLSGHTHGGQVVFAKIGETIITPALLASRYVSGAYTKLNSQMYVTRGIGVVGIPVRINCPPEITKITLVVA